MSEKSEFPIFLIIIILMFLSFIVVLFFINLFGALKTLVFFIGIIVFVVLISLVFNSVYKKSDIPAWPLIAFVLSLFVGVPAYMALGFGCSGFGCLIVYFLISLPFVFLIIFFYVYFKQKKATKDITFEKVEK